MAISVSQTIQAPRSRVWSIITDIDHAAETISGITRLEVLERPANGLAGLKWKETRIMFGKEAIETMWISGVEEGKWYETTAFNHGMEYRSRLMLSDSAAGTELTMSFDAKPLTFVARLFAMLSFLFAGAMRKVIAQDLKDIQKRAESTGDTL